MSGPKPRLEQMERHIEARVTLLRRYNALAARRVPKLTAAPKPTERRPGRYIVAKDMVKIEDVFSTLKEMYPNLPVAALENQDIASGIPGAARKIDSRVTSLGLELKPFQTALKDAVDSMIDHTIIAAGA